MDFKSLIWKRSFVRHRWTALNILFPCPKISSRDTIFYFMTTNQFYRVQSLHNAKNYSLELEPFYWSVHAEHGWKPRCHQPHKHWDKFIRFSFCLLLLRFRSGPNKQSFELGVQLVTLTFSGFNISLPVSTPQFLLNDSIVGQCLLFPLGNLI